MTQIITSLVYIPKEDKKIYAYPPLPQDSPYLFDLLPMLAFPDIQSNPVYFIVPSTRPIARMFGISMIYKTHCLVILTNTLYIKSLTNLLQSCYLLFTKPTPQLLTSLYKTMISCPLAPEPLIPTLNSLTNIVKIMKLSLLPFKTVIYSEKSFESSLSLLFLMSSIPGGFVQPQGETNEALGFPLQLDTNSHPIIPHFPGAMIDKIIGTDGYIIATSNPLFNELTNDWDVVINIDNNKVSCQKELKNIITETKEDRVFLFQLKDSYERKNIIECMKWIEWYYQGLLNTIAPFAKKMSTASWEEISQTPANDYGLPFIKEFLASPCFQDWKEKVSVDKALRYDLKHPGRSSDSSFNSKISSTMTAYFTPDWLIKSAVKAENFYNGLSNYFNTNQKDELDDVDDKPIFEDENVSSIQNLEQNNTQQNIENEEIPIIDDDIIDVSN